MARSAEERIIRPSRHRRQHDRIVRLGTQLADAEGSVGEPFRAEGLLGRLERNGDIGPREREAGEEFHRLFQLAALDPIRAADMSRISGAPHAGLIIGSESARRKIWKAIDALGGQNAPCGSCCWYVLGCEYTMRDWARREGWGGRPVREEVAKGLLIGGLGILEKHFNL